MRSNRRLQVSVGLDAFAVVLFVAMGRHKHDHTSTLTGIIDASAPFLLALTVAWVSVRAWRRPTALGTALAIWPVTLIVGMIVRSLVFDRKTSASFVLVTTAFLGVFLIGWRVVLACIVNLRGRPRFDASMSAGRPVAMTSDDAGNRSGRRTIEDRLSRRNDVEQ